MEISVGPYVSMHSFFPRIHRCTIFQKIARKCHFRERAAVVLHLLWYKPFHLYQGYALSDEAVDPWGLRHLGGILFHGRIFRTLFFFWGVVGKNCIFTPNFALPI